MVTRLLHQMLQIESVPLREMLLTQLEKLHNPASTRALAHRAVYEPLADRILIIDTPDWGPADLATLPYRHVPRDRVFPFVDPPSPG